MNTNKILCGLCCSFFYVTLFCFCVVAQVNAQPPVINKGFGFSIDSSKDGTIIIMYVVKTSPADRSGLKAGDVVNSVNKKKIKNYSLQQFLDYLSIQPDNDNIFDIESKTDDILSTKTVSKKMKINKMPLTNFYDTCIAGNCKDGFGKKNMKNGSYYEGTFLNGKQDGKGKLEKTDGGVYEGEFKDDKAFGQGKLKTWKGNVFEGIWDGNPKTGKGVFIVNGTEYDGEIKDGMRNGKGTLKMSNGSIYRGDFVNDRAKGKGSFMYPTGKTYTGDFVNNKKEGKGIITWPNGDKYTGEFKNDSTYGPGRMFTFSTQKTVNYDLVNGVMQEVQKENVQDKMTVKLTDDFSTKKSYNNYDETFTKIADGKLTITSIAGKTINPYYRPFVRVTNFSVSVEATHISGIENNAFGIFILSADATQKESKELGFGISAGGTYAIYYGDKNLVDWKINDNIKKNSGTNTLMIKRIDGTYYLYINNVLVEEFKNLFIFEYFDVGFVTVDKQTVEFDNLIIKVD